MILRKHSKKNNTLKIKIFFIGLLFIVGVGIIITNDFGLIQLFHLKKQQSILQHEIQTLAQQHIKLNKEITQLDTDRDYLEKIARERFMMAKPGEKIFRVIEYKQIK